MPEEKKKKTFWEILSGQNPYEESGGEPGVWKELYKQEEEGWDPVKKRKRTKDEQDRWMKLNRPHGITR